MNTDTEVLSLRRREPKRGGEKKGSDLSCDVRKNANKSKEDNNRLSSYNCISRKTI